MVHDLTTWLVELLPLEIGFWFKINIIRSLFDGKRHGHGSPRDAEKTMVVVQRDK